MVDARLKGLSIESNNTQNGLWTNKLWPSEVEGHNQKICSKEQCHPGCCKPCVLLHLGLISEPKGFGIWIYLFQGDMFSYVGLVTSQATRARLEKSSARDQLVS